MHQIASQRIFSSKRFPIPTSHRRCANRDYSSTIPGKELYTGDLTAARYKNKRILKVINTITMVTV